MLNTPQRSRGKRLFALAAVVIGGVLLAQRFILSERVEERQVAARAEPRDVSKRVERTALESKPSPTVTPAPSLPYVVGPTTGAEPSGESKTAPSGVSQEAVPPAPATSSPPLATQPSPARPTLQPLAPTKPAPRPVRKPLVSRDTVLATDEPSWGLPSSSEASSAATNGAQSGTQVPSADTAPTSALGSSPSTPAPVADAAKGPVAAPTPVASSDVPPTDGASTTRAFAAEQAQQQLAVATHEASKCASLGSTRGGGKVNVSIATWGRVVRVTHLNQAFVGTPVGVCVMEAFQRVQVPPFDGSTQTLAGSFLIQ